MAILVLVLAQRDYGPLPVHFVGKAGTAMLMIAIVALIFADIWSNSATDTLHLCGLATGIWGGIVLACRLYLHTSGNPASEER